MNEEELVTWLKRIPEPDAEKESPGLLTWGMQTGRYQLAQDLIAISEGKRKFG